MLHDYTNPKRPKISWLAGGPCPVQTESTHLFMKRERASKYIHDVSAPYLPLCLGSDVTNVYITNELILSMNASMSVCSIHEQRRLALPFKYPTPCTLHTSSGNLPPTGVCTPPDTLLVFPTLSYEPVRPSRGSQIVSSPHPTRPRTL